MKLLNDFINNNKHYPILAGFSVGFYAIVFYFSTNFDLVNSLYQTTFFICFYLVFPILTLALIHYFLKKYNKENYTSQIIFIVMLSFFSFFVLQNVNLLVSFKKLFLIALGIIFILSFKINSYKHVIVFLFFLSFLPAFNLGKIIYLNFSNSSGWKIQPDNIVSVNFNHFPNIYFIQPDGYTNDISLKNELYNFDNSKFDNWLESKKFKLYKNFRSNYSSTLLSNSSCFFMKHHYSNELSNFNNARDYIVGQNPVLKIFKNNNYKTFFITEWPYLLMNRPKLAFDYCNFDFKELPFLQDGWSVKKDITQEIENQILNNKKTNNFFFIQKFSPSHISVVKNFGSNLIENERKKYLDNLIEANKWLERIVSFIDKNDPSAIIIIGADHGGFVGFEYTKQSFENIKNPQLLQSIFGSKMAIKWNDESYREYDASLKTSVNLFRVLFSFMGKDKELLNNLQPDISYNNSDQHNLTKIYEAIKE